MSTSRRPGGPPRRAMVRWSWRMFRREWRQQLLVLSLVTIAVAASVTGSAMAMNTASNTQAAFGTATAMSRLEVEDRAGAEDAVATARARFGTVEVIGHRPLAVPGVPSPLDLRSEDPDGTFGAPLLRLRDGRYPSAAHEIALTPDAAELLDASVGDAVDLDRQTWSVVGLVENPRALSDTFALATHDQWTSAPSLQLLFQEPRSAGASANPRSGRGEEAGQTPIPVMIRGNNGPVAALVLVAVALLMTLVGLIAAAGFVVLAQRRQRQLGLLAAIGATQRHLRTVVLAHGAIVGLLAAAVGGVLGILGWFAAAPAVEQAANRRIERFDLPWGVLAGCLVLAVVMAVAAAWWPARRVARIPVIAALSGRPPKPAPVHRSTIVAVVLLAGGMGAIAAALPNGDKVNPLLLMAGVIAVGIGSVFIAPAAVRLAALPARRLPLPSRLAVRDLARFQSRAASALAAIAFAIGLSVTIVAVAKVNEYSPTEGNLPANQVLVRMGAGLEPVPEDGDPAMDAQHDADAQAVADAVGASTVLPLDVALPADRGQPRPEAIQQALKVDDHSWRGLGFPYVATDEVLRHYGIDPGAVRAGTELLTSDDRPVVLLDTSTRDGAGATKVQHVDLPTYFAAPHALVTERAIQEHGWERRRDAWLIETERPLTPEQVRAAREAAAADGMSIETRISQDSLARFRNIVTVTGALLGLAIVAMTVGLIRTESARDVRTLTATGASSRSRRAITASTAGVLAALGVALGIGGAYLALVAGYHTDLSQLVPVPWIQLVAIACGLPILATAAGWLLAGREPATFSRQTFD
ncbi:MAG: FtsX-like permease family protein [Aquihabitans sp.]